MLDHDPVFKPKHYHGHPAGIECIQITEHMNFNLGNVVKYVWRAGKKGPIMEDLEKAKWYLDREITRLRGLDPARNERPMRGLEKAYDVCEYCGKIQCEC